MLGEWTTTLRFVTYLAPSIPEAFHRALAAHLSRALGVGAALEVDARRSGPQPGDDPFSRGQADVGFMCAPCYLELRGHARPPVELLAAPVYADPRNRGRAVYFSEVVVGRDADFADFADAAARGRWTYNDSGSLSGYHSVLRAARAAGVDREVFADAVHAGSHLRALQVVAGGDADAAAIDANVLALLPAAYAGALDALRVLATLGPHPVQPAVVRADLPPDLKARLRELLLGLADDPQGRDLLAPYGVERFVPVDDSDYACLESSGPLK
ncbi:MAG: PhnD/SsuA/transferrin family substrate-binding protein [Planctomycetes bacterium]|nr:PhnD/SsuA/transferrin family substrate-binding protein [Planctomycetota bacterium]